MSYALRITRRDLWQCPVHGVLSRNDSVVTDAASASNEENEDLAARLPSPTLFGLLPTVKIQLQSWSSWIQLNSTFVSVSCRLAASLYLANNLFVCAVQMVERHQAGSPGGNNASNAPNSSEE
jgi:hypothetical protein